MKRAPALLHRVLATILALLCVLFALACSPTVTPKIDTLTAAQKALDDGLSLDMFKFPGGGSLAAVTSSFIVPLLSKDEAFAFTWSSTSRHVKKIDPITGQVFIDIQTESIPATTSVTLTVVASPAASRFTLARAAAATDTGATRDFTIMIAQPTSEQAIVDAVLAGMEGNLLDLSGSDSPSAVSGNFTLPLIGNYGTEITWVASGEGIVINADGTVKVTTPAVGSEPFIAWLTPTVKKNKGSTTTEPSVQPTPIELVIPPLTPDQAVEKDIVAIPELISTIFAESPAAGNPEGITGNFTLPATGDRGTMITWTSSEPTVLSIASNGTCTVVPDTIDTPITLTAAVTKEGTTTTMPASATVKLNVKGATAPATTTYTVTFDSQSATTAASPASLTVTGPAATTVASLPSEPVKTGYSFGGWYTATDGGSQFLETTTVNADVTAYARWTAVSYAITYNLDGGSNASANPSSYDVTTSAISLASPARTGFSFGGWYGDAALSSAVTAIAQGSTGDRSFWARWLTKQGITASVSTPAGGTITLSSTLTVAKGSALSVSVSETFATYAWYLDMTELLTGDVASAKSCALGTSLVKPGIHELLVVVTTAGGASYAKRCAITVTN